MNVLYSIPVTPPARIYGAERHHLTLAKELKRAYEVNTSIFSYNVNTIEDIWRVLMKGTLKKETTPYGDVYKFPVANIINILLNPFSALAHKAMFIASHVNKSSENMLKALTILSDFYLTRAGYTYASLVKGFFEKIKPDVVHVYGIHLFWLPYLLAKFTIRSSFSKLVVWTIYHHYVMYERLLFERPKIREMLTNADAIITSTKYEKSIVEEFLDKSLKNDINVIPVPIDLESFLNPTKEYVNSLRERLGNPENVVLTMTLNEDKGSLNVLRSLLHLEDDYDVTFVSFGRSKTEDLNKFNKLKEKLPKNVKAFYFGYVDEKTKAILYTIADVFAMPSIADSFGIAYAEAWYYNTPVIADNNPVMREVIGYDRGILVRRDNIDEIKEAIRLLIDDKNLAKKLAENGKKYLHKELNSVKVAKKIKKLYESI